MPDPSGRRRSARCRIAARVAAGATAAFALLTWGPVLAASDIRTIPYSCIPADGSAGSYPVRVALAAPDAPEVNGDVRVTWQIAAASPAPGQSALLAPAGVAEGGRVVAEGRVEVTGTPVVPGSPSPSADQSPSPSPSVTPSPSPSASPSASPSVSPSASPSGGDGTDDTDPGPPAITLTPAATATVSPSLSPSATLSPIPELIVTLTPTATGPIGVSAGSFTLRLLPSGDATGTGETLYTCTLPPSATPASLALTIVASSDTTPTGDGDDATNPTVTATTTATTTATATATVTSTTTTTARATTTATATVSRTVSRTVTAQVSTTPVGGAQTGAGGDAGPDARLVVLTGVTLLAAAAAGGLLLRRFGPGFGSPGGP